MFGNIYSENTEIIPFIIYQPILSKENHLYQQSKYTCTL